jgi:hypothetical protein
LFSKSNDLFGGIFFNSAPLGYFLWGGFGGHFWVGQLGTFSGPRGLSQGDLFFKAGAFFGRIEKAFQW